MLLCAPLGLRIGVCPRLQHYQDYQAVTVKTLQRRTHCVMALAQEERQALLMPLRTDVHSRGGAMQWCTEVLRPGRQPGMATLEAYPLARHCIRLSGVGGRNTADELMCRLKAIEGAMVASRSSPPGPRMSTVGRR